MPLINDTKAAEIPAELDRWNWGAFFLNWIWGIGNSTYIALLMFVPIVNVVMIFVLGAKGSKWAWRNRLWRDAEHFRKTQRKWAIAGLVVWISLPIIAFLLVYSIGQGMKSSGAYQISMERLSSNQELVGRIGAPIKDGLLPFGSIRIGADGSGAANFQISLTGSTGKATAIARATKSNGVWTVFLLVATPADGGDPVVIINTRNIRIPKSGLDA